MKIEQARVSGYLKFFKEGFMQRWKLSEYHDANAPCVFFGVDVCDVEVIRNHKGLKIVAFVDISGRWRLPELAGVPDLVIADRNIFDIPPEFKSREWEPEIKDYSIFAPNALGDKIYCYVGTEKRKPEFNYDRVRELQDKTKWEIVFGLHSDLSTYDSIMELKQKYYDQCFVNLNMCPTGSSGFTTVRELAYMGRYTIMNTRKQYPCLLGYKDDDDLIRIIEQESQKIGTSQPSINCHRTGDEWLDVDFWVK